MRKKPFLIVSIIIVIIALWNAGGFLINREFHKKMKSYEKGYCYQTYWGKTNPALFVKNRKNIDSLIQYYQKIENGKMNATFNFPPLSLPYDTHVNIISYEKDSLIAEVICYYDWGKQGNYVKGFVYSNTLHKTPPNDSLINLRKQ